MKKLYAEAIVGIQRQCPELLLCGSAALIVAQEMDPRKIGDIDFVINKRHLDKVDKITSYLERDVDSYTGEPFNDGCNYQSYHATYKHEDHFWTPVRIMINVLVFDDDEELESHIVKYNNMEFTVQDIDTILSYKRQYNRPKDKKDLENIATKCLETILSEPEEA